MIRQTKPSLVALYDIRPGNGAGPFLQPRSPQGSVRPMSNQPIFHCSMSTFALPPPPFKGLEMCILRYFLNA